MQRLLVGIARHRPATLETLACRGKRGVGVRQGAFLQPRLVLQHGPLHREPRGRGGAQDEAQAATPEPPLLVGGWADHEQPLFCISRIAWRSHGSLISDMHLGLRRWTSALWSGWPQQRRGQLRGGGQAGVNSPGVNNHNQQHGGGGVSFGPNTTGNYFRPRAARSTQTPAGDGLQGRPLAAGGGALWWP